MVRKLELINFKGIKEGKIELYPFTILLGPNNSGKTTILEALFLAPNPFREVPYYPSRFSASVVHSMHRTLDSLGYAFLLRYYTAQEARISCDDYWLGFFRSREKPDEVHVATNMRIGRIVEIEVDNVKKELHCIGELKLASVDIPQFVYKNPLIDNSLLISTSLLDEAFRYMSENWASIVNTGVCKEVAEDVLRFTYETYEDITLEPFLCGRLTLYAYSQGRRLRIGDIGSGVQNYMIARILYEVTKPKILLWDDVEAHMNPRMLIGLADWFSELLKENVQIVVTTHSLEAAKILSRVDDKTRVCITSLKDGVLNVKTLTTDELDELCEAGIDIRVAEGLL